MRALSLTRPWTTLVLHHGKDVENRTWNTAYRGPILIHGAKSWDGQAVERYLATYDLLPEGVDGARLLEDRHAHPVGVLGVARLVSVCTRSATGLLCDCGPWAMDGQHHWRLADTRAFPEPLPVQGQLGLWKPGEDVLGWVLAQAVAHSLGGPR